MVVVDVLGATVLAAFLGVGVWYAIKKIFPSLFN